jgi:hypothetical protein
MSKAMLVIEKTKALLNDDSFKADHRCNSDFFTRNRILTFFMLILLILRKSPESVQLVPNEFFDKMDTDLITVAASASAQARSKMLHTAFIELNQKAVVETVYENDGYEKFRGFRLLGLDGSEVILPNEHEIRQFFGSVRIANQHESTRGEFPFGIASVLCDLPNNVAIDALLGHAKSSEIELATEHLLSYQKANDLVISDRNYPSYRFLAFLIHNGIGFVGRCSRSSFKEAREMFRKKDVRSQIATLEPHHTKKKQIMELGLPLEIRVRFVSVPLGTGETEVLVTSLCDESLCVPEDFGELYNIRWNVETFYGTIKGRPDLENFTGKTVESVRQDFYSTIFISGLESVLIGNAQERLAVKDNKNKYHQTVNKAVSSDAIKNHIPDLFYKEQETEILLDKLTRLFMTGAVCKRKKRKFPRKKRPRASPDYHKRLKKIVF